MPWTDSRSRDEWLAEVRRRGTRIRRRRRVGFSVVGALALVLPVSVTAGVLSSGSERAVELSVAGPAPVGGMAPLPATIAPIEAEAGNPEPAEVTADVPPAAGELSPTTTTEVHRRVATINGALEPPPPTTVPPVENPVVVSPSTTLGPIGTTSASSGPATTAVPSSEPSRGPWCALDDVRATVTTEKSAYAGGEMVRGVSTLQNRGTTTCALLFDVIISIRNAAGRSVDSVKVTDFKKSLTVGPGGTFASSFTWDQKDCASVVVTDVYPTPRERCAQVPPGTYTATDNSGGDSVAASFQIGA